MRCAEGSGHKRPRDPETEIAEPEDGGELKTVGRAEGPWIVNPEPAADDTEPQALTNSNCGEPAGGATVIWGPRNIEAA
jgi:hypothetical protein